VAPAPESEARRGGAPTRPYVVLEQIQLEGTDGDVAYQNVLVVEARNGTNALRKAFKELRGDREDYDEATLAVIPEGQWKPTPVRADVLRRLRRGDDHRRRPQRP
jgi:hypothetical protein